MNRQADKAGVDRQAEVEKAVVEALAQVLAVTPDSIDPDAPLNSLPGMESVKLLRAVVRVEESCGIAVPDEMLFEAGTARELAGNIAKSAEG
ncbi:acyl carrier protein [Streptomyces sp. NPDC006235]|uniref:acyl carrier protein n=1 Tax=Streptomyces sp. NPDC006235 TaxID=3156736 RepID=UPI0033ABDAC7